MAKQKLCLTHNRNELIILNAMLGVHPKQLVFRIESV